MVSDDTGLIPRPAGRGPIEAIMFTGQRSKRLKFRDQLVAAPLKLDDPERVGGRGPIEASGFRWGLKIGEAIPRPAGRGPIEARSMRTRVARPRPH